LDSLRFGKDIVSGYMGGAKAICWRYQRWPSETCGLSYELSMEPQTPTDPEAT